MNPTTLRHDIAAEHPELVARARAESYAFRWKHLQTGRFHLRLRGRVGQRVEVRIETDDLFDANFVTRPEVAEESFEMDLMRTQLALNVVLEEDRSFVLPGQPGHGTVIRRGCLK